MKNIDKWNSYMTLINERELIGIKSSMIDIPKKLYEAFGSEVREWEVTSIDYDNRLYKPEKVTNKDVETIKSYYESFHDFDIDKVVFHLRMEGTRTGCRASDIGKRFLNKEEAEKKANDFRIKSKKEKDLLDNGHVRCSRCQNIVKESESIKRSIIYRDREQKWDSWKNRYISKAVVKSRVQVFCSGQCASHEQMSMEG